MKLIDSDNLLARIEESRCKPCREVGNDRKGTYCSLCWVDDMTIAIDSEPEIVMCEACVWCEVLQLDKQGHNIYACMNKLGLDSIVSIEDYCSRGERRE